MFTPNEQGNIECVEDNINRRSLFHNVFQVPHNVLEDGKFKAYRPSIKVLYIYLAKLTNRYISIEKNGWIWRSSKQLEEDTGLNEKTIRAAKKQLLKDGFIEFKDGAYNPETKIRHAGWFRVRGYEPLPKQDFEIIQQQEQKYDDCDAPYKTIKGHYGY